MSEGRPALSGVVVHWHNEAELAALVAAWPEDPRFELLVVDNGSSVPLPQGPYRLLRPGGNLGFAGAVNLGASAARGEILLILNPDAHPEPGALEGLLAGFAAHPDVAGLAPRLVGRDGVPQFRWQLRRLPRLSDLLRQAVGRAPELGPATEPPPGAAVEQPAAAALALRRAALTAVGGLDPGFYPAWFEDVDLARRLARRGLALRYWPAAVFRHGLGASVPRLGYGAFLWLYDRGWQRYLRLAHGAFWAFVGRMLRALGLALRLVALPFATPARASSRREAVAGLAGALAGTLSGWRFPASLRRRFPPPEVGR